MNKAKAVGGLRVRVFSGDGAFPIKDAIVLISPKDVTGENNSVMISLRTDESGLTEMIPLAAKPRELSEMPGNKEPFNSYNVEVKKEGYYTVNDMNVPVFEGVEATLPVNLVPLAAGVSPYSADFNENRIFNDISTGENLN